MSKFSNRNCTSCNSEYTPTGPAARFCPSCAEAKRKEAACRGSQNHRIKYGLVQNPGVGKGGANKKGVEDGQYKTGIVYFMKNRRRIKDERRYCERCRLDLENATRYGWVIHHIDHNRANNVDSNFELLCKRCHQLEHDCEDAFLSRATTIPQGSRD